MTKSRSRSATRFTIQGGAVKSILLTVALLFAAFMGFRVFQLVRHVKNHPVTHTPGAEQLTAAMKSITSVSKGAAQGNSVEGVALAKQLSDDLLKIHDAMFVGGKADSAKLTKGTFLVFCQLNEDSCAFIIHVPEMRHYTEDAAQSLAELAYDDASRILDSAKKSGVKQLAVATRGVIFFNTVLIGDYVPNNQHPSARAKKAEFEGAMARSLLPFFAEKTAAPTSAGNN